jgi:hypothetical protein
MRNNIPVHALSESTVPDGPIASGRDSRKGVWTPSPYSGAAPHRDNAGWERGRCAHLDGTETAVGARRWPVSAGLEPMKGVGMYDRCQGADMDIRAGL